MNSHDWYDYCEIYIVTEDETYLRRASSEVRDSRIAEFLSRTTVQNGTLPPSRETTTLIKSLASSLRVRAILTLLSYRNSCTDCTNASVEDRVDSSKAIMVEDLLKSAEEYEFFGCAAVLLKRKAESALQRGDCEEGLSHLANALTAVDAWGSPNESPVALLRAEVFELSGHAFALQRMSRECRVAYLYAHDLRERLAANGELSRVIALAMCLSKAASDHGQIGMLDCAYGEASKALTLVLTAEGDSEDVRTALAYCHNTLGCIALAVERVDEAERHHQAALDLRRVSATEDDLATSLYNLGTVQLEKGERDFGESLFTEAMVLARQMEFSDTRREHIGRLHQVMATVQLRRGRPMEAVESLQAARGIFEIGVRENAPKFIPYMLTTLSGLAIAAHRAGLFERAVIAAKETVEYTENIGATSGASGPFLPDAGQCREILLDASLREGDAERILSNVLGTSPAKSVASDAESPSHVLASTLLRLSTDVDREVGLLFVRRLRIGGGTLFGIVYPGHNTVVWEVSDRFASSFAALSTLLLSQFDADNTDTLSTDDLMPAASGAWSAMPSQIRNALDPSAGISILLCVDRAFANCPFEALKFGDNTDAFLGLHACLPRVSEPVRTLPLFGVQDFGRGARECVIFSPWKNQKFGNLPKARDEALLVRNLIQQRGLLVAPDGSAILGEDAGSEALARVMGMNLAILHYAGHAGIAGAPGLLLWDDEDEYGEALGPSAFRAWREDNADGKAFMESTFVVLNACTAGTITTTFSGNCLDLVGEMLACGAEGVVANPVHVEDTAARAVSAELYALTDTEEVIGDAMVRTRQSIAFGSDVPDDDRLLTWPWYFYFGNPFARIPRQEC